MTEQSNPIILPEAPDDQAEELRMGRVAAWREPVTIDTYLPGDPTRFPMFLDRRVYQGSSGKVYPLPLIEEIDRESRPRLWDAIHIENEWVRLMLLPEIGGRIHIAMDKSNGHDFFYRNNVIKPALVGLAGPWISGGVEFNWPQHHRPTTFLPVRTHIEHLPDGSVAAWHSDTDPFDRMTGTHAIVLRPQSSLIEVRVRLHNRTSERKTFLWWANAAARAGEHYQSFFPDDVHWVADHARRSITAFPHSDRPYYGVDYPGRLTPTTPEADRLDWFRNIPVPTSYMALGSAEDFMGGYDHEAQAGFVHWADHRMAPGKKQWTWGNSDFGRAWEAHLTDSDGPYVELMAGVFTDNQPDFSWLMPGEVREFSQFWFPYRQIGPINQATTDAAVSVVRHEALVRVGLATTSAHGDVRVALLGSLGEQLDVAGPLEVGPGTAILTNLALPAPGYSDRIAIEVRAGSALLVRWDAPGSAVPAEPGAASVPQPAAEVDSVEQLHLTGVHLEQYRHPTRSPRPYWLEALRRDPAHSPTNLSLSAASLRSGDYRAAEQFARTAVSRLTTLNSNPADGEAFYRLGLALERLGRHTDADEWFAKASWDGRWAHAASLERAFLAARAGDHDRAAEIVGAERGHADNRMRCLAAILQRRDGDIEGAERTLRVLLEDDPLDRWAHALLGEELELAGADYLDVAGDFRAAGEWQPALEFYERAAATPITAAGNVGPMALYLGASTAEENGEAALASELRDRARRADARLCFPSGLDALDALRAATAAEPNDSRALELLGTWHYAAGNAALARTFWAGAMAAGPAGPVLLRNLALSIIATNGAVAEATDLYARALEFDPGDGRLLLEVDTLAAREGDSAAERLRRFENAGPAARSRDDLIVRHAHLLASAGRYSESRALLLSRRLQPWEGGEGAAIAAYEAACIGLARDALSQSRPAEAADLGRQALETPDALGEARLRNAALADVRVLLGDAAAALGDADVAEHNWRAASLERPTDPAKLYWAGVAAIRIGDHTAARDVERLLLDRSSAAASPEQADYFATSLPSTELFGDTVDAARRRARAIGELAEQLRRDIDAAG